MRLTSKLCSEMSPDTAYGLFGRRTAPPPRPTLLLPIAARPAAADRGIVFLWAAPEVAGAGLLQQGGCNMHDLQAKCPSVSVRPKNRAVVLKWVYWGL